MSAGGKWKVENVKSAKKGRWCVEEWEKVERKGWIESQLVEGNRGGENRRVQEKEEWIEGK